MKKIKIKMIVISLVTLLLLVGCKKEIPTLEGYYKSSIAGNYNVEFSFMPQENAFSGYINGIAIDHGIYESLEDNRYTLKGDTVNMEIELQSDDSFNITIEKLNDGKPIQLNNIDKIPAFYAEDYSEEELKEVKDLLD